VDNGQAYSVAFRRIEIWILDKEEKQMKVLTPGGLILIALLLVGCDIGEQPKVPEVTEPVPAEETFLDPQLEALEKARGVEGMLQDSADQRRELLEKEGG
jgi:hypothetical protein